MKSMTHVIIAMILLPLLALGIIVGTSKVQDMTLKTDGVMSCNEGWSLWIGDKEQKLDGLPYYGKSGPFDPVPVLLFPSS